MKHQPPCDICGTRAGNVRRHRKLRPRDLAERFAVLCTKCAQKDGWNPVDYTRVHHEGPGASSRGWTGR